MKWVEWAEDVFGAYRPAMRSEVEAWLSKRNGCFMQALREIALRDHPSVYGKPPGVHELEVMREETQALAHRFEESEAIHANRTQIPEESATPEQLAEVEARIAELKRKLRWDRPAGEKTFPVG